MENDIVNSLKNRIDNEELHMSRIPRRTKRWFTDYADDYFCGDYGMCFKHICNSFRGMSPIGYDELADELDALKQRLNESEVKPEQDKKIRTMVNGKTIRIA